MEGPSLHQKGLRLLIADDHAMFAEALQVYLEKTYTVVGLVRDGHAMVAEARRVRPDVIVVDVGMPFLNGLDAARRINAEAPNIRFVFLTMRDDPNLAAAALELGAVGFVLKHSAGQELLKAIDHVLHGKPYLTPKLRAEDWVATKARARQFSKDRSAACRGAVHQGGRRRLELKRKNCGVPQTPHHECLQPGEQRRPGFICLEARIDLAQSIVAPCSLLRIAFGSDCAQLSGN
jgi:DNA-binding response OmpR family regulator